MLLLVGARSEHRHPRAPSRRGVFMYISITIVLNTLLQRAPRVHGPALESLASAPKMQNEHGCIQVGWLHSPDLRVTVSSQRGSCGGLFVATLGHEPTTGLLAACDLVRYGKASRHTFLQRLAARFGSTAAAGEEAGGDGSRQTLEALLMDQRERAEADDGTVSPLVQLFARRDAFAPAPPVPVHLAVPLLSNAVSLARAFFAVRPLEDKEGPRQLLVTASVEAGRRTEKVAALLAGHTRRLVAFAEVVSETRRSPEDGATRRRVFLDGRLLVDVSVDGASAAVPGLCRAPSRAAAAQRVDRRTARVDSRGRRAVVGGRRAPAPPLVPVASLARHDRDRRAQGHGPCSRPRLLRRGRLCTEVSHVDDDLCLARGPTRGGLGAGGWAPAVAPQPAPRRLCRAPRRPWFRRGRGQSRPLHGQRHLSDRVVVGFAELELELELFRHQGLGW